MSNIKFEKRVPVHGKAGVQRIIEKACSEQASGTCDGARPDEGTSAFVFGRIANMTPSCDQPPKEKIAELGALMLEDEKDAEDGDAAAGIAFLGQFMDHDLTLDATTELGKVSGHVDKIRNFRTPALDLDCVYGDGPEIDPWLYDMAGDANGFGGGLIFGRDEVSGVDANDKDLQRNIVGRALIGDPRNDENLFVSQVHGRQFVHEHNLLAKEFDGHDNEERYKEARKELTLRYHRRVIHEFLPAVVHPDIYWPMLHQAQDGHLENTGDVNWAHTPMMPVEFSAAAFRFGHSMIRETYDLNGKKDRKDVRIFAKTKDDVKLDAFRPVDPKNNLKLAEFGSGDKDLFFGDDAQRARKIDTNIPGSLIALPDRVTTDMKNLAERNMVRGHHTFKLPTGEDMARLMGAPLIDADDKLKDAGMVGQTPLWYYILSEAEQNGGKLGHVGGSLVAGVILKALLRAQSAALMPFHVA